MSEYNTVDLKEYFEALLVAQNQLHKQDVAALEREVANMRELVATRQEALALAVEKQENAYDIRFAGVNEWRQTFGDIANKAVSQDVFNARYNENDRRLNALEQRLANYDGRIIGYSAVFAVAALIIAIAAQFLGIGG